MIHLWLADKIMDELDKKYPHGLDIILSAETIGGKVKVTDMASSNPGERVDDFINRFIKDHPKTENLFVYMSGERQLGYGNGPIGCAPPITKYIK